MITCQCPVITHPEYRLPIAARRVGNLRVLADVHGAIKLGSTIVTPADVVQPVSLRCLLAFAFRATARLACLLQITRAMTLLFYFPKA